MADDEEELEIPDEKEDIEGDGMLCFLDDSRECGPSCMAFTTFESESPMLNDQQKHCSLIVAAERLGRHTGGLLRMLKDSKADEARKPPTPPSPTG